MRRVDTHLKKVWPVVMEEWKNGFATENSGKNPIALVTRDCSECETRVRVGVLITALSPNRPPGERAFCATCNKVTFSPVMEVRGLVAENDENE